MIVTVYRCAFVDENIAVAQTRGGRPDEIYEPRCGVLVSLDLQIGRTNHVRENHCFDAFEISGERHAGGQLAAAESAIRVAPLNAVPVGPLALRFFTVEKHNPGVESALGLASTKDPRQLKHGAGA